MTPLEHLRWATPALRALANIRILADGTSTLAVLDLIQRAVPEEYRSPEPQWLYTHTTHLIQRPGQTDRFQMPAVALTDGPDRIIVQVGIPDSDAWERLRGKILPRFQEGDRTIDFPPLPDHPLW
jgi:hypothetical protein